MLTLVNARRRVGTVTIQKGLPKKLKDPGSFNLPMSIGALSVDKALLDLGASINLIYLAMLKKIGYLMIKSTKMTLQLVDRVTKYPYGVVEDVLVKEDKFIFTMDFVVMDMEKDEEVPLIHLYRSLAYKIFKNVS